VTACNIFNVASVLEVNGEQYILGHSRPPTEQTTNWHRVIFDLTGTSGLQALQCASTAAAAAAASLLCRQTMWSIQHVTPACIAI